MCSSVSLSSVVPLTTAGLRSRYCDILRQSPHPFLLTRELVSPRSSLSISAAKSNLAASWFRPDWSEVDDYGGWAIVEAASEEKKKGLPKFLWIGIGTPIAILLAVIAQLSVSRGGMLLRLSSPFHALRGISSPFSSEDSVGIETSAHDALPSDAKVIEAYVENVVNEVVDAAGLEKKHPEKQEGKLGRILIPPAVDSTQQEALRILKKLQIIEEDIKAGELCTRREYARWLVRANLLLERNPKHRILPAAAVSGSITETAFDDIHADDPDFEAIQSLAEAGIVHSRLASKRFSTDPFKNNGDTCFFPERFLSRLDLIDWKAKLDYEVVPGMKIKISGSNLGFMDVREISTDGLTELSVDMMAGDDSIFKKVFGQGKRFQPTKPSTNAQAAVALTSGRMAVAIQSEISRLDAEYDSRQRAIEEIRSELLGKGVIKGFWDRKIEEEKARASEMVRTYLAEMQDLEQDKIFQESALAGHMKQRAAMDCQKQLFVSLKQEVDEMSERLAHEKTIYTDELRTVRDIIDDSGDKLEGMMSMKSILEAEIEALRILRSWIEDEARKSKGHAKVLEEVGRRWKWDNRA